MKAVGLYKYLPIDQADSLMDIEVDQPTAKGRDLLVEVRAIAVNPVDTKVRSPKEKVEEEAKILGWDAAGVVTAVGEECCLFQVGDEVYYAGDLTRQGSYAQFQLVDERIVGRKPSSIGFAEAAAMPLTAITAYESLFDRLCIPQNMEANIGKSILVIGAAGGVGSIACQLANRVGLTVIGTASRPATVQWAKDHGCHHVITHYEDFVPQLNDLDLEDVDYILCLNSTDQHWDKIGDAIKAQGTICTIVDNGVALDMGKLKVKSAGLIWELMFTRSMYKTPDMIRQHELLCEIGDLVDQGLIQSTLNERISPINARNLKKVHKAIESGTSIGKTVLEGF